MSIDTDIERYLHARATDLHLPPGDLGAVTRRARHLRRRRTAARTGVMAALLAGGALLVVDRPRGTDTTEQAGEGQGEGAQVASPLEWTMVPSGAGLGWSRGEAVAGADGTVYSLSTAPGEIRSSGPKRLYRSSSDAADWEEVGLPEGLYATGLAAADGSLYAVGTTAAGGETVGVSIATSTDGGGAWSTADVPLDLAAVADGFPGHVWAQDTAVATAGGTTVVAVTLESTIDASAVITDGSPPETWMQDAGGMVHPDCPETPTMPTVPGADEVLPEDPAAADWLAEQGADVTCEMERRSWADLGLTADQARLAEGETHLFISTDGGEMVPAGVVAAVGTDLLAADDGWWLLGVTRRATDQWSAADLSAWHSTDGGAWGPIPLGAGQWPQAAGVVGGRPVVVAGSESYPSTIWSHRIEADGSVTSIDLGAALGVSGGNFGGAIGELGVALVMPVGDDFQDLVVAHSSDGVNFTAEPLPGADAGIHQTVAGVTVTADAVKVRLNLRDAADRSGEGPADQRVFVGVPG